MKVKEGGRALKGIIYVVFLAIIFVVIYFVTKFSNDTFSIKI